MIGLCWLPRHYSPTFYPLFKSAISHFTAIRKTLLLGVFCEAHSGFFLNRQQLVKSLSYDHTV